MRPEDRKILAWLAARGILGHNTTASMFKEFHLKEISAGVDLPLVITRASLGFLVRKGFASTRNTGHNAYGDTHTEDDDVWKVTAEGLMRLWT